MVISNYPAHQFRFTKYYLFVCHQGTSKGIEHAIDHLYVLPCHAKKVSSMSLFQTLVLLLLSFVSMPRRITNFFWSLILNIFSHFIYGHLKQVHFRYRILASQQSFFFHVKFIFTKTLSVRLKKLRVIFSCYFIIENIGDMILYIPGGMAFDMILYIPGGMTFVYQMQCVFLPQNLLL